jgi:ribosomal protein S20
LPNIKSAKRRVRVEEKANLRNRVIKSELKTIAKKFSAAVSANDKEAAATLSREYTGALDKAAIKGAMHRNCADRRKAQICKAVASLTA